MKSVENMDYNPVISTIESMSLLLRKLIASNYRPVNVIDMITPSTI